MQMGFKTGPKSWEEGQRIVLEDGARMCEIWFRVDKAAEYDDMITWLQEHDVAIGLHHWGLAPGNTKTNLATSNEEVRNESIRQMKQTIDIGAGINCAYVNVHPGARCVETINFDKDEQHIIEGSCVEYAEAEELLLSATKELQTYAQEKDVLLTVETLPGQESNDLHGRQGLYNPGNPLLSTIKKIGEQGGYIANDITHSLGQLAIIDNSPEAQWQGLKAFTEQVQKYTRLLHINTVVPPYNGTDSHSGITDEDFKNECLPTRDQLKYILSLFKNREDVFIVPEPTVGTMQQNYQALQQLVSEV